MAKRPYTGWNGDAKGRRAGTEKLIQLIVAHTGKNLWNNGSWGVRSKRGKSSPSIHGTGRAFDLSWRNMGEHKGSGRYEHAVAVMDLLVENADALGIEAVFDYYPAPFGRGWKCDRDAWTVYDKQAFHGAPGGDWIHVEVSDAVADDPARMEQVWNEIVSGGKPAPAPKVEAKPEPKPAKKASDAPEFVKSVKRGSRGEHVKLVQQRLADLGYKNSTGTQPILVDGQAGKNTIQRIKDFQSDHPCPPVDGICGKLTWAALFGD
ncbi:MAG: peptidoglycan-binding protein [Ilumatobacteraceae bacterium]